MFITPGNPKPHNYLFQLLLSLVRLKGVPGLLDHILANCADVVVVLGQPHLGPDLLDAVGRSTAFPRKKFS